MAEVWALRALHDGPSVDAMVLLSDLCRAEGDLINAQQWLRQAVTVKPRLHDTLKPMDVAATRGLALERELREDWSARAPIRQLHFCTDAMPSWSTVDMALVEAIKLGAPVIGGPAQNLKWRHAVIDSDLAFIAWRAPLQVPLEDMLDQLLVLPVREVPMFGETLTLTAATAELLREVPLSDPVAIARALPADAQFGVLLHNNA